jgi:hypothetical protein
VEVLACFRGVDAISVGGPVPACLGGSAGCVFRFSGSWRLERCGIGVECGGGGRDGGVWELVGHGAPGWFAVWA